MVEQTDTRISAEEYYQLPEYEHNDLIQLIDGEVVIGMPPVLKHQMIVKQILFLLTRIEQARGGLAMVAPTEVQLDAHNVFEPDVLYITPENMEIARKDEKRIIGAPDLVVQVLSPGTAKKDREQKYNAYQQHGVGEYWIVDPLHDIVEVWTRGDDNKFKRQGTYDKDDTFESTTLGETVNVKAILTT